MNENATNSVEQEVATPEHVETNVVAEEAAQQPITQEEENPQERNWRNARQKLQEQSQEIQYLKLKLDEIQKGKEAPQELEEDLTDDDFVRGHHLKKKLQMMEQALLKNEAVSAIDRARAKFDDFDSIVSVENVELLKQNDPELAISLKALANDPYAQALATYKVLKRSDYSQQKQGMENKQRIEKNLKKPLSSNAVSPLAEANRFANGLTPDLKKALLKEMQEASKRAF